MNVDLVRHCIEAAFHWAWQTSLEASLLIVLVLALQACFGKRLPARALYLFNLLVLVRLLTPVVPATRFNPASVSRLVAPLKSTTAPSMALALTGSNVGRSASIPEIRAAIDVKSAPNSRAEQDLLPPKRIDVPQPPPGRATAVPASSMGFRSWLALTWALGAAILLGRAIRRHRLFARWIGTLEPVTDHAVLCVLRKCSQQMRVRQAVSLVMTPSNAGSPALFGWRKPRLLLPKAALLHLSHRELEMVFLHELAHVKCHDILINWLMIAASAGHWFNPLAWLAMRRLRADRELVRDGMVLGALETGAHRLYGETLLKLAQTFSGARLMPSLVPVLNSPKQIHRRIVMITHFKPLTRTAWIGLGTLTASLALLAFTRAADEPKAPAALSPARDNPGAALRPAVSHLNTLKRQLDDLDQKLLAQKEIVGKLRLDLGLTDDDSNPGASMNADTIRAYEHERISSEARAAQFQRLYELLKDLEGKDINKLAQAVPTAVPDTELTRLLGDFNQAQEAFAKFAVELGADNPQLRAIASTLSTTRTQIVNRTEGILLGLQAQAEASRATAQSFSKELARARAQDAELTQSFKPYFEAKRELDRLQRARDKAREELFQELLRKEFGGLAPNAAAPVRF